MKTKHFSMKSVISMMLALVIIAGTLPVSVFAAQSNEYVDPADNWLSSNNRTNELDVNATITNETQYCNVCKKFTMADRFRSVLYRLCCRFRLCFYIFFTQSISPPSRYFLRFLSLYIFSSAYRIISSMVLLYFSLYGE